MSVTVVVADRRTHACLFAAVLVKGRTGRDRYIGESPVMVVTIENARGAVAGDENVGPAIFVEVECRDAEAVVTVGAVDMRLHRNIFKCSVTAIVIENIFRTR